MSTGAGTCAVTKQEPSGFASMVEKLLPDQYNESELEQLVQTITDQIMAAA